MIIFPIFLLQVLLLQQHFADIRACSAAFGRVFTRQAGAAAASAARQGAQNALHRAASQALSNAGSEVAKKTIGQTIKNAAKKVGEKGTELAGQAVVFGLVDQAGDSLRGSSDTAHVQRVEKVVGNQLAMTELQNNHSVRQMDHDERMAKFDIQKLQIMNANKPTVIIEEMDDEESKNTNASHSRALATGRMNENSHVSTDNTQSVPKWMAPAAYFAGSFGAFLTIFVVYKCFLYACEASNKHGRRADRRRPKIPRNLIVAGICLVMLIIGSCVAGTLGCAISPCIYRVPFLPKHMGGGIFRHPLFFPRPKPTRTPITEDTQKLLDKQNAVWMITVDEMRAYEKGENVTTRSVASKEYMKTGNDFDTEKTTVVKAIRAYYSAHKILSLRVVAFLVALTLTIGIVMIWQFFAQLKNWYTTKKVTTNDKIPLVVVHKV